MPTSEKKVFPAVTVLIVAGGSGSRMGYEQNKLFLPLGESCILGETLKVWQHISQVDNIVIVAAAGEEAVIANICAEMQISKLKKIIIGGAERQDSVWQGLIYLESLTPPPSLVAIHDGARPFYDGADFSGFLQEVVDSDAAGGILGVPVQDTIKTAAQNLVTGTVPREHLVAVQTPQLFWFTTLYQCYEKAMTEGILCTDDAGVLEANGKTVRIYQGQKNNLKITTPEDYTYVQFLWKQKKKENDVCE